MGSQEFKPAWWLANAHLQTIFPPLCRRRPRNLTLERERIELPDGDFVDLEWIERDRVNAPLVMILHGLEGSIESHYAKTMLNQVANQGWRGVFMHFRGCSGEHNRLPRWYHSGDTADLSYITRLLLDREPDTILAAMGFSLGGNVLLKWMGETQYQNPLKAAVAISVPFELHKAARRIQEGFSKFYQWYFIRCLRERLTSKFQNATQKFDVSLINKVKTMYEFDDKITAPFHGFNSADHYYNQASSKQYLRNISVPTLLVQAKDDPFMSEDVIPKPYELSPAVKLELTEAGGHVGFVTGIFPWKPKYWLDERIPQFLKDYLE